MRTSGSGWSHGGAAERAMTTPDSPRRRLRSPRTQPPTRTTRHADVPIEVLLEVSRTLGELRQAVTMLTVTTKDQGDKLDKISKQINWATGAVSVLLGIIIFLLTRYWDRLVTLLTAPTPSGP